MRLSSSRRRHAQTAFQALKKDDGSLETLFVAQMPWQNHKQGKDRNLCQILPVVSWENLKILCKKGELEYEMLFLTFEMENHMEIRQIY